MAGGKLFAVATYISGVKYLPLLLAWLHSVARVYEKSPNVDIVIIHCEVDVSVITQLQACAASNFTSNITLVPSCIEHPSRGHPRFREAIAENDAILMRYLRTFGIYRLWGLTQYERILFLDVDIIALRPLDFAHPRFAVRPGALSQPHVHCVRIEPVDTCNTGVLVVHPSEQMYARITGALKRLEGSDVLLISDQAFFTTFFAECVSLLPREYNYLAMLGSANWPWRKGLGKALHFHYRSTLFKPIDMRSGVPKLAYNALRPDKIFAVFHHDFGPMHACYSAAVRRGEAPALFAKRNGTKPRGRQMLEERELLARLSWERRLRRMDREARALAACTPRNGSALSSARGHALPSARAARGGCGVTRSTRASARALAAVDPAKTRARDLATTKLLTDGYKRTPQLIDEFRCHAHPKQQTRHAAARGAGGAAAVPSLPHAATGKADSKTAAKAAAKARAAAAVGVTGGPSTPLTLALTDKAKTSAADVTGRPITAASALSSPP